MKLFECQQCGNPIFFENQRCENCGRDLGYLPHQRRLTALETHASTVSPLDAPQDAYRYCANHEHDVCNWLVPAEAESAHCIACDLNETIPDLSNAKNRTAWQSVEVAKHRLVYSLMRFGLPFETKAAAPETGLAFAFLADTGDDPGQSGILTGHSAGRITINIAEAEPARREATRTRMAEPYRTLIGHFRHEIGHYYWQRLIAPDADRQQAFRALFGDERADYAAALAAYYDNGPPPDWQARYISAYSAAHPWEAWAETWSHYFHLVDTLETAQAFGVSIRPTSGHHPELSMQADFDPYRQTDVQTIVSASIPLTLAVNSLNRSMGQPDLYPFVLSPAVRDQLGFIHGLIRGSIER